MFHQNDLVQYWEHDPATKVILLYLESFGNPPQLYAHRPAGIGEKTNRGCEERFNFCRLAGSFFSYRRFGHLGNGNRSFIPAKPVFCG